MWVFQTNGGALVAIVPVLSCSSLPLSAIVSGKISLLAPSRSLVAFLGSPLGFVKTL
jgi:hypothetical protein